MIFFCGDPHGKFAHIVRAVQAHRPAAVILLGDLQPQRPLHVELAEIRELTEIWWIHGNHDTDEAGEYENLFGSELADRNLDGRVVEIDGLRVAGLGGIFRGQIWWPPEAPKHRSFDAWVRAGDAQGKKTKRHLSTMDLCQMQATPDRTGELERQHTLSGRRRKHKSSIWPDTFDALAAQRADLLVTHEAPQPHPFGFATIGELAQRMGAAKVFHGHHHDRMTYTDGNLTIHGVGFCGISDLDGRVIQEGDFDDARAHRAEWRGGGDRK